MSTVYSNNLYPFEEEINSLEAATREAEWEEDTRDFAKKQRRRRRLLGEDDDNENDWTF